jgi:hypothetical protein
VVIHSCSASFIDSDNFGDEHPSQEICRQSRAGLIHIFLQNSQKHHERQKSLNAQSAKLFLILD